MTNQRKHITQMTRTEITAVTGHLRALSVKGLNNPHVIERKSKWNVTDAEIVSAVKHGDLIECHANNYPDIRMVTRKDEGMRSICVCCNKTGEIVTVWVNTVNDNHSTLRVDEYKWQADLTSVFA